MMMSMMPPSLTRRTVAVAGGSTCVLVLGLLDVIDVRLKILPRHLEIKFVPTEHLSFYMVLPTGP